MTGAPEPVRFVLGSGRRVSLWTADVGLACCAVEFVAATAGGSTVAGVDEAPAGAPPPIDVLLVSGTVTDKVAPAVRALYDRLPGPPRVLSFGACANTGGPYWDSYSVVKGVDRIVPVDVYVPGCPPRPEALLQGLLALEERL